MLLCSGEKTDVRHREVQTACFSPAAFLVNLVVCLPQTAIKLAVSIFIWHGLGNVSAGCQDARFVLHCHRLARFQDVMAC